MPAREFITIVRDDPYSDTPPEKTQRLLDEMNALTAFHGKHCKSYHLILEAAYEGRRAFNSLFEIPFLPVRLFKETELISVPTRQIVKVLTSSGTSAQRPSRIFLDKETAIAQARALVRIVRSYLGSKRLPMLILDHPDVLKDRNSFSARGAGILGFSQFGCDVTYALKSESMLPDWERIGCFLTKHRGERILLFGFTFIIWQHLLMASKEADVRFDCGDSILVHGGGWKKLEEKKVSNEEFKQSMREFFGIGAIHNYYGMVEQTGSIAMECEEGYFHVSDYSEVIIRNPRTLNAEEHGIVGLIETMSTLPRSYPGHALLTEDLGVIRGADGCGCGRRGTYFSVLGRLPAAELRGCSDTHEVAL